MAETTSDDRLARARRGDIAAFHDLYAEFKDDLRAFGYRLLADRNDADDLAHDTFVRAFERLPAFEGRSTLKTWMFSIAAHRALDLLRHRKRWPTDILDLARNEAIADPGVRDYLAAVSASSPQGAFELAEHVDFCFTCISQTLPLEAQVALLLSDIYEFTASEAAEMMGVGVGALKHRLRQARQTMQDVFDDRCALIRRDGPCHQCSQLNGWLNPRQSEQQALISLEMVREATTANGERLFNLREKLVRGINPLTAAGSDLHEAFFSLHRRCAGEVSVLKTIP